MHTSYNINLTVYNMHLYYSYVLHTTLNMLNLIRNSDTVILYLVNMLILNSLSFSLSLYTCADKWMNKCIVYFCIRSGPFGLVRLMYV